MNHNWADQYARQRFDQLSHDVRGDQLLRMSQSDDEDTAPTAPASIPAKLRIMLSVFEGVGVTRSWAGPSIAALLVTMLLAALLVSPAGA